jgi:hypothetical protein
VQSLIVVLDGDEMVVLCRTCGKDAVRRGDITWHAFPFNSEPEVYDSSLFQASVNLAKDLAQSLGRPAPRTLSQRGILQAACVL